MVLRIITEPITFHPADVAIVLALSTLADPVVSDSNTNVTGNSFGLADLLKSTQLPRCSCHTCRAGVCVVGGFEAGGGASVPS